MVDKSPRAQRREHSEDEAQRQHHRHCADGQSERVRTAARDEVADRLPQGRRLAEVAGGEALQPVEVALDGRLVESERLPLCREVRRRGVATENRRRRISRQRLRGDEDERADDEDQDQRDGNTTEEEPEDSGSAEECCWHGRPKSPGEDEEITSRARRALAASRAAQRGCPRGLPRCAVCTVRARADSNSPARQWRSGSCPGCCRGTWRFP